MSKNRQTPFINKCHLPVTMPNYQEAYKNMKCVHEKQISVDIYNESRFIEDSVINQFLEKVVENSPESILEAGVGNGRFMIPLSNMYKGKLIGIDVSKTMINDLNKKVKNIEIIQNNIVTYKPKQNVDVTFSFATLHIIQKWKKTLDNIINYTDKKIILGEEVNQVFHGTENLFEDDDYRLKDIKSYGNKDDINKVIEFFKEYHSIREELGFPFKRFNSQILHGDYGLAGNYLREKGLIQKTYKTNIWTKPHTFNSLLNSIKKATITTMGSDIPNDFRFEMYKRLKKWDDHEILEIPAIIYIHEFKK